MAHLSDKVTLTLTQRTEEGNRTVPEMDFLSSLVELGQVGQ